MFPNKFAVYLHDTPQRDQFDQLERDFSSGCIRLENVIELAAYVLNKDSVWNRQRLTAALQSGAHQVIFLADPIPVHLVYMTAWVDGAGVLQFRKDIYSRDAILAKALARPFESH
jgi:murein L,D-transpeptidase YcbB/YkuD